MGECKDCFHTPSRVCPAHQPKDATLELFSKAGMAYHRLLMADFWAKSDATTRWWKDIIRDAKKTP